MVVGTMTPRFAGPNGLPCVVIDVSVFGERPGDRVIDHRCDWCKALDRRSAASR